MKIEKAQQEQEEAARLELAQREYQENQKKQGKFHLTRNRIFC
jgi:hypothetical protein